MAPRLLPLLLLAACAGAPPPDRWERSDHAPVSSSDSLSCRAEARRQAEILYPDREPNDAAGRPRMTDQRNFPAEIRFFDQCMTRLGYVRAPGSAS
jgi:hypothetical protein